MRFPISLLCIFLLSQAACCPKVNCDISYASTVFRGFRAQELDSVRIISADTEGNYPPDTVFSEIVFYNDSTASPAIVMPFNKRNIYEYYVWKTGMKYRLDSFEFSKESCGSCIVLSDGSYHDVLRAYRLNGVRQEGSNFEIRK